MQMNDLRKLGIRNLVLRQVTIRSERKVATTSGKVTGLISDTFISVEVSKCSQQQRGDGRMQAPFQGTVACARGIQHL
jgi:hypothetical protein